MYIGHVQKACVTSVDRTCTNNQSSVHYLM